MVSLLLNYVLSEAQCELLQLTWEIVIYSIESGFQNNDQTKFLKTFIK